jgi:hypothetical protein
VTGPPLSIPNTEIIPMTTDTALCEKINAMADQLQIIEMLKGWHHMMGSQLNQEYETLMDQYEKLTGHRNTRN